MWDQRHLIEHIFPFIFGSFTPPATLTGGTVEYPVFSGLFMWVSELAVSNGLEFLAITTVLMAIASTVIAPMLLSLVGRWALLWSFAPALFLYTSYNMGHVASDVHSLGDLDYRPRSTALEPKRSGNCGGGVTRRRMSLQALSGVVPDSPRHVGAHLGSRPI